MKIIGLLFFLYSISTFVFGQEISTRNNTGTIILDPAHGGKEPGAVFLHKIDGNDVFFFEKEIVLRVAYLVRDKLNEIYAYKNIILTREDDAFVSMESRTYKSIFDFSNDYITSLLISIHIDFSINQTLRGYNIFISDENSYNLANYIRQGFNKIFENDLPLIGIRQYDWYILRESNIPAILINIGYLSNIDDVLLLYSDEGLEKCAQALVNGIVAYFKSL